MTKGIRSYSKEDQPKVAKRRLLGNGRGWGYLAALGWFAKNDPKNTDYIKAKQSINS